MIVTPERWYIAFWGLLTLGTLLVGAALGAGVLYFVVTKPLLSALERLR